MRTRRATRSARLALAIAAAAALTATLTACEDEVLDNGADSSDSAGAGDGGSGDTTEDDAADGDTGRDGSGDGEGNPVEQTCGTTDLTFTVSTETQAGGYFLVTAQANEGITCHLEGSYPAAAFGSAEESHADPAGHAVGDSIKLSGDAVAYAGITPKTTSDDNGVEYEQLIIGILGDESDPASFPLDEPVLVDQPVATNWTTDPADAVPFSK
ncbi:DUF4232 domain-containing protein [Streptomyces sp. XM4011]|uniref:DUF4232 domain-containing protein n=1 Tax=Streptomyces TaxID=1883 RepID=UPI001FF8B1D2|nr:DUF4232 domain-containing protein [Streptomyces sp. XM4011]MCK1816680.1 DUF4232 domain-containing protein [Streptomyces sp. XM4011]